MSDPHTSSAQLPGPEPVPALRRLAASLVLVEGLALLAGSFWLAVAALRDPNEQLVSSLLVVVIGLLLGGALSWCAMGLLDGARWSRGPVVTWQLVQIGVAMPVWLGSGWWLGVPLLLVGIAVLVLVAGGRVVPRERP